MSKRKHFSLVLIVLAIALTACIIIASTFGTVKIPALDILKMTLNKTSLFHFQPAWSATDETIIFQIRLPRVIGGALVGAALASAGVLFQGLLRNPMADPYIIGTSAGAAFGAAIAMMLPVTIAILSFGLVSIAAFIGALVTVLLVYNLARVGGRTPVISMLLAGFATSSLLAAVMTLLMTINNRLQLKLAQVFRFLMGSISVSDWQQLAIIAPLVIISILAAQLMARHLNALSLGEEGAAHLGINIEREKLIFLALGSLLTASAVSISGLVGFVGLITPHALRLVIGPDHRLLLPASALAGGIFLIIADLIARIAIPPAEIPLGAITAIIGAPFFIYLLRRSKKEYSF